MAMKSTGQEDIHAFPGLRLWKGHGISFFGPNISGCFMKTRNIDKNMTPKGCIFSISWSWKFKLVMEKSSSFIAQFLCELCQTPECFISYTRVHQ